MAGVKTMVRDSITFGDEVFRLREASRLSPHEVAAALGCTFLYLRQIEAGIRKVPRMDLFERLLQVIGANDHANLMAKLAARSKPKIFLDTSDLPVERTLLAIQFNRKVHRLSDESATQIGRILEAEG
jgi:transcriptional regulator with XRE-family HTH domain